MAPKKRNFGNIRTLPSGRFQARYTAPDGSVIKAPTTFVSRRHADQWLATEHADLTRGTWRDPNAGSETLSEYMRSWITDHSNLRPGTRQLYWSLADRLIIAGDEAAIPRSRRLGPHPLREITPAMVRQWFAWVQDVSRQGALAKQAPAAVGSQRWNRALRAWAVTEGFAVKPTGRIPTSVWKHWEQAGRPHLLSAERDTSRAGAAQAAQAYRLLRAVLQTAVGDALLTANPCEIKGASNAQAPERDPATPEQVAAIYAASPDRYRVAVLIGAWGGLRAGEIFALRRRDVDLEAERVTVGGGLSYITGKGFQYGPPKNHKGYRKVHLPAPVIEAIAAHMDEFTGPERDALIFTTGTGRPVPSSRRTTWFRRAAETAGRDDLRFHDLRHTGATYASRAGATIADVQQRIGHSTPRAAMLYQHTWEAADRQVAKGLEVFVHVSSPPSA